MIISIEDAINFLENYKYLIIFPIVVLEGPIITVISGFLVYLGKLNWILTYTLLVIGDLIGDALHYVVGRYWRKFSWAVKVARFFKYDENKEKVVEEHFKKHPGKTVLFAKVSHGIGGFIQIVAGEAKISFWLFMRYCFYGTVPKSLFLFLLGYYLGESYLKINMYLGNIAYFTIFFVVFFIIYLLLRNYVKKKILQRGNL